MPRIAIKSLVNAASVAFGVMLLTTTLAMCQEVPKTELYLGYSFLRVNSAISVPAFTANGGLSSFQYNFNKNFAVTSEFGGVHNGNINDRHIDSTMFTYLFGPRLYVHKEGHVTPFFETLFGGMHYTRSFLPNLSINPLGTPLPIGSDGRIKNSQDAFAMAVGGGLDLRLGHLLAFRPIQLDYLLTRFQPIFIAGLGEVNRDRNQNNLRYSTGFAFRFGGGEPPTPTASCVGHDLEALPDDPPLSVAVHTTDFNPKHPLTYQWDSTAGKVIGDGSSAKLDLTGAQPGTYQVTSRVTDPKQKKNNVASCNVAFTVKEPRPPVVSCSASPSSIVAGATTPVTINVQGSTPDGRPIKSRKVSASAGSVREGQTSAGTGPGEWASIAALDTNGVQPGKIDINIGVTDSRGLSSNCLASVDVQAPPAPPAPPPPAVAQTQVGQCDFSNGKKPSRVDNACKAALDDTAMKLKREPDGQLVIVGFADAGEEAKNPQLSGLRALNAKTYLTAGEGGQGIDASRIEIRKGKGEGRNAVLYWVPAGGTFAVENTTTIDDAQLKALAPTVAKK
jgi:outer membrane protein OmpA-like peptidoglycan-associated protein